MNTDPVMVDLDRYLDSLDGPAGLTEYIDDRFDDKVDELFETKDYKECFCELMYADEEFALALRDIAFAGGSDIEAMHTKMRKAFIEYVGEDYIRDLLADEFYEMDADGGW